MNRETRQHRSFRRLLGGIAMVVAGLAVAGELVARFGLGLGDPPLYEFAPGVEYLPKPGTYRRFGNIVQVNSRHMRSVEFPERKSDGRELRVMMLGDSVVNGGGLTDQRELASEIIGKDLAKALGRPVTVGNISAGSWGPGNLLAYVRRFGLCDADIVVLVLNSKDIGDNPTDSPALRDDPSMPSRTPWTAVGELLWRYVGPRFASMMGRTPPTAPAEDPVEADARSVRDLEALCEEIAATGATIVIMHFPTLEEVRGQALPAADIIKEDAAGRGIGFQSMQPPMAAAFESGINPYRPNDTIHPNAAGQRMIARQATDTLIEVLNAGKSGKTR